jgi:hypothetical protein
MGHEIEALQASSRWAQAASYEADAPSIPLPLDLNQPQNVVAVALPVAAHGAQSVDALIASLDEKIIRPAEARFVELLKRKADTMGGEHV